MKKALNIAKEVISWALLIAVFITFCFTVYMNITNKNSNEGTFLFGYRPVLVLTGSMEPYMMTNGLALTKAVSDLEELAVDDVITYHVENEAGGIIRITHRIIGIEDGYIYTKGDNNNVSDGYPLTIENVEAKVVSVFNGSAWVIEKWQSSTAGKVMLISFGVGIILLYIWIDMSIESLIEKAKEKKAKKDQTAEPSDVVSAADPEPSAPQPETSTSEHG